MIKWILSILLLVLLLAAVQRCEKAGSVSNFISELVVDAENLFDDTKEKIEEKRKERADEN